MDNGAAVIINNEEYSIGAAFTIAGKSYKVYNTMPALQLIGFGRTNKKGEFLSLNSANQLSLSFDQISTLSTIGTIQ